LLRAANRTFYLRLQKLLDKCANIPAETGFPPDSSAIDASVHIAKAFIECARMPTETFNKAAILGSGLIGASIGLALKQRRLARHIIGLARRAETLAMAQKIGAIDTGTTHLEEALEGADLVIYATPVLPTFDLIEQTGRLAHLLGSASEVRPLLTDACSTKAQIVAAAQQHLPDSVDFVAGHPMAGLASSGPEHANGELFSGATWIFTPTEHTPPAALARATTFAMALDAVPLVLDADIHDQIVAQVSHLPHLLAVALTMQANELALLQPETWRVAAGGFRDMTRLAAGSAAVWRDICLTNSQAIAQALADFRGKLQQLEIWLQGQEGEALMENFEKAGQIRAGLKE
jgi:prephenate dehydrogenase